jgi:hypothetical protein
MDKFQEIKNNHLALTQYYRWYQVYEVPFTNSTIINVLDILSPDVEIASQAGTTKGKDELVEKLKLYEGWKNAHHVKNTQVYVVNDKTLKLEADILYQNLRPDDSEYNYNIHYTILLEIRNNDLPVFKSVTIQPTGSVENLEFISSYSENRAKSFMHYWLYLMETIEVNVEKLKELLAENFELTLSETSKITTLEKFKEWASSVPTRIKLSGHYPKNLVITENNDSTIDVTVDFEWQGVSIDNKPMIAETHHQWTLENNLEERFARMKKMFVTQTKPFQLVEL